MTASPTVRRRRIARELRQLRERAGMTLDVAARQLDMSKSNLSRIENAQIGIKPRDVRAALALYQVTGADAEALIEIARGAQQRGWWQHYSDVLPEWFEFYVGLEAEAATLRTYEAEAVPGLLQTEAYAREVYRLTAGEEDLDRKVAARLRRQEVLHSEAPVELSVVLNEAALLRPVSNRAVMAGQATHLEDIAQLPNVTIQVLPFEAGGHPAMNSPYVLLTFADTADAAVVYLENLSMGMALEEVAQVRSYSLVHERLRRLALDPAASLIRLKEASRYFT
ncbi:Helix-turn-helix domain-containing protein [Micromonospora phaseoli]|uniref:Helix-turn-helix domain-containing protein n=1 Tax=Micromonospora phaseoli TaxID=1144548 RepID=A0A1H6SJL5_9ACTN|nr:helix-turn-helix transcriptional regulator [Micromonospora phaseoli]PZW03958.1 helix-turn-helix protein [Micromonospora phaseoli]GIJ77628.1 transcriptional regulator [Micromonospora phaseoli]SEI67106.1 Helix-turn-helix domain-containing protein [Micromonospora phaseoli]